MLDTDTKRRIDTARDILVGKVPDPKSQVEQITIALIYKFMDDMDAEAAALGGERTFFKDGFQQYAWPTLMSPALGGREVLELYSESIQKMNLNPNMPQLFRDIFKNAFLPYRDPETLKAFLKIIDEFRYDHSEKLGDAFEYLLSVLGSQGDAGQFRTPRHIIDFIVDLVDPHKEDRILDVACGTAGFLISAYKHILKHNSSNVDPDNGTEAFAKTDVPLEALTLNGAARYKGDLLTPDDRRRLAENIHGYDISPDMVRLSLVNMYLHNIQNPRIEEYDTLTSEDKWGEYFDVILANPPFMSPKGGIRPHNRFSVTSKRSEVLFVDYIAEHLTPQGRAGVIVPEGIIFQSQNAYKQLREMLVNGWLVAVVSLPVGVFNPYSGVKTSILLLDKSLNKKTDSILFVKIDNDGFGLGAQRRPIQKNDLPGAASLVKDFIAYLQGRRGTGWALPAEWEANALLVEKERLAENGEFNLSGERYRQNINALQSKFELVKIGDICEIVRGSSPRPKNDSRFYGGKVPRLMVADVTRDGMYVTPQIDSLTEEVAKLSRPMKAGELVMAVSGNPGLTSILQINACIHDGFVGFRELDPLVKVEYLHFVLSYLKDFSSNQSIGAVFKNLTTHQIRAFEIPLPPLDIQREIVAEIEGCQKIIDGARQVVENYKPQITIDPEWEMVELGEVCIINPSKSELAGIEGDTEVSFIPMADLNENQIDFNPRLIRKISDVIKGYTFFRNNDVLLAKITPCFENGKAGVAENLENDIGFGSTEFIVLRANKSVVLPNWIYYFIAASPFREFGTRNLTGSAGQRRVPKQIVKNYKIPLPDLPTQERIVARIEREQALVNANKELIELYEAKIKERIARVWGEE